MLGPKKVTKERTCAALGTSFSHVYGLYRQHCIIILRCVFSNERLGPVAAPPLTKLISLLADTAAVNTLEICSVLKETEKWGRSKPAPLFVATQHHPHHQVALLAKTPTNSKRNCPPQENGTFAYFCCRAKVCRLAGRTPPVLSSKSTNHKTINDKSHRF